MPSRIHRFSHCSVALVYPCRRLKTLYDNRFVFYSRSLSAVEGKSVLQIALVVPLGKVLPEVGAAAFPSGKGTYEDYLAKIELMPELDGLHEVIVE